MQQIVDLNMLAVAARHREAERDVARRWPHSQALSAMRANAARRRRLAQVRRLVAGLGANLRRVANRV